MGGGSSKAATAKATAAALENIPVLQVPMKHLFGKRKGETVTLKFRALRPPETTTDAEYRIHKALQMEGFEPTEPMINKLIDRLVTFTRENGYKVPGNQARRRPTVTQTLIGSATRAIFSQYDQDNSGSIDATEFSTMMTNVRRAMANDKGEEFIPTEEDRIMSLKGAEKVINALDADGNGTMDEDEFCDAVVRSFEWSTEERIKNIKILSKNNQELIDFMNLFFNGMRFCVGHILESTSASIIEKCLNPIETLEKGEAEILAAERVIEMEEQNEKGL
jgi:Ca2+-binding EF-hand superfamily protein